jgi:hypothetical protein
MSFGISRGPVIRVATAAKTASSPSTDSLSKNVSGREEICETALYAVIEGDSSAPVYEKQRFEVPPTPLSV